MIRARDTAKLPVAIGYQHLYLPAIHRIKKTNPQWRAGRNHRRHHLHRVGKEFDLLRAGLGGKIAAERHVDSR